MARVNARTGAAPILLSRRSGRERLMKMNEWALEDRAKWGKMKGKDETVSMNCGHTVGAHEEARAGINRRDGWCRRSGCGSEGVKAHGWVSRDGGRDTVAVSVESHRICDLSGSDYLSRLSANT